VTLVGIDKIIGMSPEIKALRALIKLLGPSDSTVLVLGESGTGKELVAQALHRSSERVRGPFVPVNCGAIPKDLLESELFGHKKGSFTGAIADRKGRFQLADKGTLFLDEIGDMSMDLQVKLLRVLQERTVDPVGSIGSIPIDVRVIAATHQNIETLIDEGRFRKDLYYRLNIMPIEVSSLADRAQDIPILIDYFAQQKAKPLEKPISISQGSMKLLLDYGWPGNVRELSNLVDRYTALYAQQEVDLYTVPRSMVPSGIKKLMELPETPNRLLEQNATTMLTSREPNDFDNPIFGVPSAKVKDVCDIKLDASIDDVQRVINLAQGGADFPDEGVELKQHLLEIERGLIRQALTKAEGNVSKTARLLKVQRTTLIEKINKYGMH
jgi:sigma-54 specific flagellar transcriptional regulator A|tara:strand:- start:7252 stop:8400 length:1149 start_codon:yes stop_codon:yes gene_type:complete